MKREIIIDGSAAELEVNGSRLRYRRAESSAIEPIERDFDVHETAPGVFSVLIEGRSYEAIVVAPGEIRVNGRTFSVEVFDPRSLRGRRTGAGSHGPQNIAAAMPGKVIRVLVAAGDQVEAGQGLVVVEAMKMQNEMKSPKAGRVAGIKAQPGATVSAGDVLLVIE